MRPVDHDSMAALLRARLYVRSLDRYDRRVARKAAASKGWDTRHARQRQSDPLHTAMVVF